MLASVGVGDIVVVGPGSEWLWSAVASVVTLVTLVAIYHQLRLARNQNAVQQLDSYNREWHSERMNRHKLAVLSAIKRGDDVAKVALGSARALGGFWEDMGALAHAGYVDPKLLYSGSGGDCAEFWAFLRPLCEELRATLARPRLYDRFEWLASEMQARIREAGGPVIDADYLARTIDVRISSYRDEIAVDEEMRRI